MRTKEIVARVFDGRTMVVDPLFGIPLPTCDNMSQNRLLAEGKASYNLEDNDFAGLGGPGLNSFGVRVQGRLSTGDGSPAELHYHNQFHYDGVDIQVINSSLTLRPDPRF